MIPGQRQQQSAPDVISAQGLTGCVIDGCGKKLVARGRCRRHYSQWWDTTPKHQRLPALNLKRLTPDQRFSRKVDVRGPGECWPWTGTTDSFGHGQFFASPERGTMPAHAYALERATGSSCPSGKEACHHCDNPPCCNPAHIYFGTREQNVADMWRRGRGKHGEESPNSRLTTADVIAMRTRFAAGEQLKPLAEDFGIDTGYVSRIVNGLKWKRAGGPITTRGHLGRPTQWRNN
jgi:hypothetical protein